jgi:tRNA dimethylallyltransferase
MIDHRPKLVVITGPTASGKTAVALNAAREFNGEIINADSMQVYRYMDIGTAKTPLPEREGIVHHMIDVADPDEEFNASLYRRMTATLIGDIVKQGKTCFLVGGTGLYIKTLLGGLMECPESDPTMREELQKECMDKGAPFLHERLKGLDPESAGRIHPNDRTRVIRAIEIIRLTGRPLSSIIMEHGFRERSFNTLKICLNMDRERLYQRIDARSDHMIDAGLVDETQALLERGYSPDIRSMNALGYRHAISFLRDGWTPFEMASRLKLDTRRYAKRQLTWFRADNEMIWVDPDDMGSIRARIKAFIE